MKAQMRVVELCSGLSSSQFWPPAKTKAVGRVKTGWEKGKQGRLAPKITQDTAQSGRKGQSHAHARQTGATADTALTENDRLSDTHPLASKAEQRGLGLINPYYVNFAA